MDKLYDHVAHGQEGQAVRHIFRGEGHRRFGAPMGPPDVVSSRHVMQQSLHSLCYRSRSSRPSNADLDAGEALVASKARYDGAQPIVTAMAAFCT